MRRAVVIGIASALAIAGAGSTAASKRLSFTRAGGAPIAFAGKTYVWCGPWEPDVHMPAVHVLLVPEQRRSSYWSLSGIVSDVKRRPRVRFPLGFVWNRPKGAELFVYDAVTKNEASSETEEAHGEVTFTKLTCAKGRVVEIDVSGVLGSEFSDGKPVRARGTLRGVVGRPPPGLR